MSRTLKSDIGVIKSGERLGAKRELPWVGLWDTGASHSLITQKIVDALELEPVDFKVISTPVGISDCPIYEVDIVLPNGFIAVNLRTLFGNLSGSDLLIGMDVIGQGDFAVSNFGGKTAFTFRVPSLVQFDFVKNSYV
jgi:hypothetical protein